MAAADPQKSHLLDASFLTRLEKLDFLAKKILAGELRGDRRTRRRGLGTHFRDHKNYVQGDDLRFLDWNVYSRLGELLVKQFEAEENLDLFLLVDASGSMNFGKANKLVFAQKVAAALGYVALERLAKVELGVLPRPPGDRSTFLGAGSVISLLRALESIKAAGDFDFDGEIRRTIGKRKGRGVAVVISDFFNPEGYGHGLQSLRQAGFRVAAVQVLSREDIHPGIEGLSRLVDIESQMSLRHRVSKEVLARYESEANAFCEGLERYCRKQDVAYVRLDSSWELERAVRHLLLAGGILR